ncbi:hypothetical protein [Citrobacter amalonaticus]|uniref:Uncharacterized protein n=1 Tax=Citrobacter amalonaticus TaxID=35703 RepID=A0A8I0MQ12_CITAM|nr:hypothetical protein [Citrobacter amalonaticus]MBE0131176.1 hypothetical protein [Citrobacter amalonaticus]
MLKDCSKSELVYYYSHMHEKYKDMVFKPEPLMPLAPDSDMREYEEDLNRHISYFFHGNRKAINKFIKEMILSYKNTSTSLEVIFDWLKNDERACFWFWNAIIHGDIYSSKGSWNEYRNKNGINYPAYHQQRLEAVKHYVSYIGHGLSDPEIYDIISRCKDKYLDSIQHSLLPRWISKDDAESCQWVWEQIINWINKNKPNINEYITTPYPIVEEQYLAVCAFFDYPLLDPIATRMLSQDISKIRSQKKFREKMKDKKPLNIHLDPKIKDDLVYLASYYDMKIHTVIDMLIRKEIRALKEK